MAQISNWVKPEEVKINSTLPECDLAANVIDSELVLLLTRSDGDVLTVKVNAQDTDRISRLLNLLPRESM